MRPKFCEKCGNKLSEKDIFCERCGWRIVGYDETTNHEAATDYDSAMNHDGSADNDKSIVHDKVEGDDRITDHAKATGRDKATAYSPSEHDKATDHSPSDHNKAIAHNGIADHDKSTAHGPGAPPTVASSTKDPPKTKKKDLPLPVLIGILVILVGAFVLWKTVLKSAELMKPPLVSDAGVFFADFERGSSLYRVDLDGKNKKRLSKDFIKAMDMEDNWIYYSSILGIYKIRDDGTDKTQLFDKSAEYIQAADGWIYFVESRDYNICRIRTDGTGFEQIGDDFACALKHEAGWLYYRNADAGHCIFRIRTDGSDRQQVTTDKISFANYDVSDGVVYYKDDNSGYLCRVNGDGTGRQELNEHFTYSIVVKGDWIYYGREWQGHPTKIRIDGSEETKISDDNMEHPAIFGDWIYYADSRKGVGLYKLKIDGSEKKKLR